MAEVPIPWPLTAHPGRRPGEGQGDLVNAYGAKVGEQVIVRRVAGVEKVLQVAAAATPRVPRGVHATEAVLFHFWDTDTYLLEPDGTNTLITAGPDIAGSDRVTVASNLRPAGPQTVVVTDDGDAYVIDPNPPTFAAPSITAYSGIDADLGTVTSVEYYSGYFVFTRTNGEIVASDLQSTAINPLSTAMAEYSSDELLRCVNNGPTLLVFGRRSTEVWTDVGSSPFPFQKQTAVDVGLLGKWCVAGGPNQWGNGVYFIASDFTVRFMDGYRPTLISNDAVSQDLYDYRDNVASLNVCVYGFGPWAVFSITSPEWTWEYMVNTGNWHRRRSHQQVNSRISFAALWNNNWYVQLTPPNGEDHGYLGTTDIDIFTEANQYEDGDPLPLLIESAPIKQFPVNFRIPSLEIDVAVGVGSYISASFEPAVLVSWSHDGGAAWSDPLIRSLGKQGEYSRRVQLRNIGRSTHHGTRLRLETYDPVPVILMGGLAARVQPSRPRGI